MGTVTERAKEWSRGKRALLPSLMTLLGVALFWVVGAVGGIGFLQDASSPMMMLVGLYVMLTAVAVSIIIATLAIMDLGRRFSRQRSSR